MSKPVQDAALRLLARREHSRRELKRKLIQRGFAISDIEDTLDQLIAKEYLSTTRFINMIVRVRSRYGYGPQKILAELQTHGVSQKEVQADEDWQEIDWLAIAKQARIKKFGAQSTTCVAERAKQYQYLIKRGFLPEHIVIDE